MRHGLFLVASLLLLFTLNSCEKVVIDGQSSADGETAGSVVISVEGVESYINGDDTRSTFPIEQVCTRLCFAVYQGGSRVKYDNQKLGDSDFGSTVMALDPGHYQLLILGHSGNANPSTTKPEQIKFTNLTASGGTGYTDTFYYFGDLEVSASMPEKSYTLERASAMFRLVVNDRKPSAVKRFYFYYTGGSGQLDVTTGYGNANSQQKVYFDLDASTDNKPLQFELYTFPHQGDQKVTFRIQALDADGETLYSREIKASMEPNFITQYSGNFYSDYTPDDPSDDPEDPVSSSSSIFVDTEWAGVEEFSF